MFTNFVIWPEFDYFHLGHDLKWKTDWTLNWSQSKLEFPANGSNCWSTSWTTSSSPPKLSQGVKLEKLSRTDLPDKQAEVSSKPVGLSLTFAGQTWRNIGVVSKGISGTYRATAFMSGVSVMMKWSFITLTAGI